ncbi:peptidyl-alpha-hydroxyglycine alpha-amidating lyase 2 [Clonorchis sinensis]|uniref:peptidylamidoglycolate lyase n=1 Tax=Clonorchis sinensis TaxID=79923 RepID=H2KTV9_CLOSI|nr:peptidyl-alpha-hydroxyglycine alpha-amidating lyase 2 [Clonorchis sinensis]
MRFSWIVIHLCVQISSSQLFEDGEFDSRELGAPGNIMDESNNDRYSLRDEPRVSITDVPEWPNKEALHNLGDISASAPLDEQGRDVLVLHRGDREWNLRTFDEHNVLRDQSKGPIKDGVLALLHKGALQETSLPNTFYMPHGLTVDPEGNIWVTDVGLHQVFKFSPDKTQLMVLGEKFKPGNDSEHFCKPTHVAVASTGDFFVSDGYCNSRIIKFRSDGTLITQWGEKVRNPETPGPYELNIPHELVLLEDSDTLCVADRENHRVVCYCAGLTPETEHLAGEYRYELSEPGPVYGVAVSPAANALVILVNQNNEQGPVDIRLYDLDTGERLGILADENEGYGKAHTVSACTLDSEQGCIIVNSLNKAGQQKDSRSKPVRRRLWFYEVQAIE